MRTDSMEELRYYTVGDARVTRIMDLPIPAIPSAYLYPAWNEAAACERAPWLGADDIAADASTLRVSVHTWLVQIDGANVLIDTGAGNAKPRPENPVFDRLDTPYLANLAAAGVRPEDVDVVIATHLHVDHVGWNTVRDGERWVPTFPNARYLFSKHEYGFYATPEHVQTPSAGVFEDSVLPVFEAGQVRWIGADAPLPVPGLQLHVSKGHSFEHLSFSLHAGSDVGLFGGDVMHHPVQVAQPDWNSVFCEFSEDARRARHWALDYAAEHRALYFSSHFAGSSAGTIERGPHGYRWIAR